SIQYFLENLLGLYFPETKRAFKSGSAPYPSSGMNFAGMDCAGDFSKAVLLWGALPLMAGRKVKGKAPDSVAAISDSEWYSTTHFRLVGPFRGGRSGA